MTHSTNQGLGRQSALTRRSFVAGASVLAAGMLLGGPFGCSAPAEEGAMVTINCAAIPESLFESEMFGYEKGRLLARRLGERRA